MYISWIQLTQLSCLGSSIGRASTHIVYMYVHEHEWDMESVGSGVEEVKHLLVVYLQKRTLTEELYQLTILTERERERERVAGKEREGEREREREREGERERCQV